ncbi:lipopolysaccharide biosynthesis protein [Methylobacterium oryzihabitans]|uniref:Lipopolysaccharide biosynthesis protein n=1 Tax=Methylobacterium oryzihabitans TaxID=2499852 RepID=A0A3S2V8N0_9HYPH|nr:oligosaccharide flippase family protein [Methylobacterium oryzihabitans]RVU16567.1 lipopolysaccharide biosynthesis protein [Methylobacterium oryzihabitans]
MAAGLTIDEAPSPEAGLARTAVVVFGVRIGAAACAFAAQVLMARLMGGTEYGIFATIWIWTALLGHASTWGLSQAACRFLPAYRVGGETASERAFLVFGAALSLGAAAALAAAGAGAVMVWPRLLPDTYLAPALLAALILPLFALQDFCEGVARSRNWTLAAIVPPYLLRQGLIMAAMLAAVAAGAPADARVAVAATLAATAVALAVQAGLLGWRLRRLWPGPRAYRGRTWMRTALPLALVDLAGSGFNFVDVLILGFLLSPEQVGLYFAATRLLQFLVFVSFAASAVTAQRYAEAAARGDRARLAALVRRWSRLTLLATLATGLALAAAGPVLLGLFGPEFRASAGLLAVLVAGQIGAAAFGPAEDVLTMLGGEGACAAVTLGLVAVAAVLVLALVPFLGVMGAAIAAGGIAVARGAILALLARRIHGLATPALARRIR